MPLSVVVGGGLGYRGLHAHRAPERFAAPLPPAGGWYNQDVTWHLSIVHELTRAFPPQIPQVAGQVLRYHWFSHVHMAAAHLVSGAPVATIVLRLWIIPLLALTALIGARLAMELSGRWWSGPVAAWGLIVFEGTSLLPVPGEAEVIFPTSPSQVYVLPLVLGVAILIVRALRGQRLRAGWALLVLMLVAAAGAKPTAMPSFWPAPAWPVSACFSSGAGSGAQPYRLRPWWPSSCRCPSSSLRAATAAEPGSACSTSSSSIRCITG